MKPNKSYQERQNEKVETVRAILEPLGFECNHMLYFEHKATKVQVDLSASDISPENLMTNIIRQVTELSFMKGQLSVKKDLQNLISSEDLEEKIAWKES